MFYEWIFLPKSILENNVSKFRIPGIGLFGVKKNAANSILEVLQNGYGQPKYAPCPLLVNMVRAGHLGVKSGMGFYEYKTGSKELNVSPFIR